jgi:hypothetical protein
MPVSHKTGPGRSVSARITNSPWTGLWHVFQDRVLIYIHKEQELEYVERLYPADHYVLIDDKLRVLTAVKKSGANELRPCFPSRVTMRSILTYWPSIHPRISSLPKLAIYSRTICLHSSRRTRQRLQRCAHMGWSLDPAATFAARSEASAPRSQDVLDL